MRLLLDQNVPLGLLRWFQRHHPEWTVEHTLHVGLDGVPDPWIANWARERDAVIITFDEDFSDLRLFPPSSHAGVVRLRVPTTLADAEQAMERLFIERTASDLEGALTVVKLKSIRTLRRTE